MTNEEINTALVAVPDHSREEIEALKDTIKASNRDMTDAQFTVFMAAARQLGLDPLARQIVPIFQGGRMTVQTTIDGFRLIAERTRKYRGQVGPFWCGPDGEWKDVWLADGAPTAAKVGVKRSDFDEPMWGVARYKSYAKGGNWANMPDVMLAKVAESLALRKAFPAELSGAYIREEMLQAQEADEVDAVEATPVQPAAPTTRRNTPQTATETSRVVEADSQPSQQESTQDTRPRDNSLSLTHASAFDQKRLYGQLAARRLHEHGGFLKSVTSRDIDMERLHDGRSDLSVDELMRANERLSRMPVQQANVKAAH